MHIYPTDDAERERREEAGILGGVGRSIPESRVFSRGGQIYLQTSFSHDTYWHTSPFPIPFTRLHPFSQLEAGRIARFANDRVGLLGKDPSPRET